MRQTRNPNLVQIGRKGASGQYVKYKASSVFMDGRILIKFGTLLQNDSL